MQHLPTECKKANDGDNTIKSEVLYNILKSASLGRQDFNYEKEKSHLPLESVSRITRMLLYWDCKNFVEYLLALQAQDSDELYSKLLNGFKKDKQKKIRKKQSTKHINTLIKWFESL